MAKEKKIYVCQNCGASFATWSGKCGVCGEWNTLTQEVEERSSSGIVEPTELISVKDLPSQHLVRIKTGSQEFDRVLGGDDPGLVPGSVVLLAGNPGVGKSTLLLQVATRIPSALYFSAEESLEQINLRAQRLSLGKSDLRLAAERNINSIIAAIKKERPSFVIIDSVQTVFDDSVAGTPGSLVQVRENCWRLQQLAKQLGTAILLVGHVTKEGVVAGPRVLEHLVDVVLYLEGEKRTGLRILRAEKNRFGSTEEIGIWQLSNKGFEVMGDPGQFFATLTGEDVPGRALSVTMEGTRSFLIEVQALATKTAFGYPKRTAQGIDVNRLNLLLAVLESRLELPLSQYDIFVNIVGGFSIKDPGVDVAIAGAVISSLTKKALPPKLILLGEIGLLGEVRPASELKRRQKEAKRLSYNSEEKFTSVRKLAELVKK
jgi:DNA repair protein RadA/Sms